MIEVPFCDSALQGGCSITGYPPKYFKWLYKCQPPLDMCFFSDRATAQAEHLHSQIKRKVALLIEPKNFVDEVGYLTVRRLMHVFDHVLTYDRSIIEELGPKAFWYPIGGCWIPPEDRHLNWEKKGLVSIVASTKNFAPGHKIRQEVVSKFRDKITAFGRGFNPVEPKTKGIAPFMFSVAVENGCVDTMFTEKLIDCFACGTVPIYYGTKRIADHFNMDGVIMFNSTEELGDILNTLTPERYASMHAAIRDNYCRSQHYYVAEDWIFETYQFLFT